MNKISQAKNMTQFILIGGSGFIGTRLAHRLTKSSCKLLIIDKKKSVSFPEISLEADIQDYTKTLSALKEALEQFEPSPSAGIKPELTAVCNLAAVHHDNVRPKSLYYSVNVDGVRHICRACTELGIKKQIFTSSVAVYGATQCDENGTINPFNDYGKSKAQAELIYKEWYRESPQHSLCIVRPTVVFGERNRGNVYNLMRQIALGPFLMIGRGRNYKSVAYVENVAAFLEHALTFGPGQRIYNYVDKPDYSMNDMIRLIDTSLNRKSKHMLRIPYIVAYLGGIFLDLISHITGRKFPVSAIRVFKFCSSSQFSTAAHRETGFLAPVPLEEAWQRTIEYEFIDKRNSSDELFYSE